MNTDISLSASPETSTDGGTAPAPKRTPRKTGKKAAPAKQAAKPSSDGKIALKSICAELKVDPKAARRKLRATEGLGFHGKRDRWAFTKLQADKIREILAPTKH